MKAPDLLRNAARQIGMALAQLDTSSRRCGECGLAHYTNREHWKVHEMFNAAPDKLRRAADALEGSDDK